MNLTVHFRQRHSTTRQIDLARSAEEPPNTTTQAAIICLFPSYKNWQSHPGEGENINSIIMRSRAFEARQFAAPEGGVASRAAFRLLFCQPKFGNKGRNV
jgi:hypothetical protein